MKTCVQGCLIPNSKFLLFCCCLQRSIQLLSVSVQSVMFVAIFAAMPAHPAVLNFLHPRKKWLLGHLESTLQAFSHSFIKRYYTSASIRQGWYRHHICVTIAWCQVNSLPLGYKRGYSKCWVARMELDAEHMNVPISLHSNVMSWSHGIEGMVVALLLRFYLL